MNKKIVVTLKYFQGELNPFDGAALECALECAAQTGGEVAALAMAPESVKDRLKSLTRLGVKAVLLSDHAFAGSDTQATSYILALALKRLQPDFIFCGRQSVDGDTAQVPPMLAQRLGFSFVTRVIDADGNKFCTRDGVRGEFTGNTVYTFEKIKTLRFPSIFSKACEAETWNAAALSADLSLCGLRGSPTRVIKTYESAVGRRNCAFVSMDQLPQLIETLLQKNRKAERPQESGEKLPQAFYAGNIGFVAESVAEKAVLLDVAGKSPQAVAEELQRKGAKTVLWENTEELKTLAARVAVITGAGLCADCISFRVENGELVMTRPARGGNVTADIIAGSEMKFSTVKKARSGGNGVIFSVGKGCVNKTDEIKALAMRYGAELCCSRAVADSGKLPYEKQVGLTGKTVSPKIYVAFGISGAVQHTCAISGAGAVIAVNKDRNARIFDYADYGIIAEV
ncbi:MAG: FAD-binding protein [Candidatus Borkfalkiaceae bacterium]|nr:FAD-binding protein [Clostridia bacterium]MDY6223682.1 FAD-binding protein [Christensenellaceae bacterium]